MASVSKLWLVARHELLSNLMKRSFLIAALAGPLFMLGITAVIFLVSFQSETDLSGYSQVGVVDQAGVIVYTDDPTATIEDPPDVLFVAYPDGEAARAAMDSGIIGGYFTLPADYLATGRVDLVVSGNASEALSDTIRSYLTRNLAASLDAQAVERLIDPSTPTLRFLDSGRVVPIEAVVGLLLLPIFFVILFMLTAQTTSGYLMSGVVEEKSNRIMEILITSLKPWELLAGKIIGLGALGLIQLAIWLAIAGVGLALTSGSGSPFLAGLVIPPALLIAGVVYFILGYAFMATAMASLGVIIGAEQEARQYAGLFSLLYVAPFIALIAFLNEPNGGIALFLSLFPLTSPTSMIMRMSFAQVPIEQHLLAVGLLLAVNIVILWIGARVFRFALLMYGKKLSLREVAGLLRRRPASVLISAPASDASAGGAA